MGTLVRQPGRARLMRPPVWALRLVAETCEREGVRPPEVRWKRRDAPVSSSSGTYYRNLGPLILVRAGYTRKDQKLVLLHELAHHLSPAGHHHSPMFWRKAWELYRRHRMTAFALIRERGYKAHATKVAVAMGIPGAREARKAVVANRRKRGVCPMPAHEAETQGYLTPHTHYWNTVHYYTGPDGHRTAYSPGGMIRHEG